MRISFETGVIELGRYQRIPINLHCSFFITAVLLTFPFWRRVDLSGLSLAAIFTVVLFASILLHELAHAMVARRYRISADRIDIHINGGMVHLGGGWRTLRQDLAITIAGPLSNLVLGLLAFGLLALAEGQGAILPGETPFPSTGILERLLRAAAYLNIGLCVVNLLPGIPLDGGRILYLLVERRWNSRIAIRVVAAFGLMFAAINMVVLFVTTLAGFPVWAPPHFGTNWQAFQESRTRSVGWNAYAV